MVSNVPSQTHRAWRLTFTTRASPVIAPNSPKLNGTRLLSPTPVSPVTDWEFGASVSGSAVAE